MSETLFHNIGMKTMHPSRVAMLKTVAMQAAILTTIFL